MKVLHVIPSVSAVHGGPSIALETMTRALADAGVEVEVATTDDDGAGRLDVPIGQPVVREKVTYWFFRRQTGFYKFSLTLTRWLAQNVGRFDAVHLHALFSYASLPAAFFAARNKVPYIVRPLGTLNQYGMRQHHPTFKRVSYALAEKRIVERAAVLHCTSQAEEREVRLLGIKTPCEVIPLGIDVGALDGAQDRTWLQTHAPQLQDRVVFLALSRLDPKKQIEVLLEACAHLQGVKVGLVVAGDGDATYVQSLRAHADVWKLGDAVVWAGFVTGAEKLALLHAADVFVLPSASENFGIAVVEAMAAGLPVIVSPEVGIASTIVAGGAGLMVSAEPKLLAEAMRELAHDSVKRMEMGARAKKVAQEKFSIRAMTDALLAMYQKVTAKTLA